MCDDIICLFKGTVKKVSLLKIVHVRNKVDKKTADLMSSQHRHEFDDAASRNREITYLLNKTKVNVIVVMNVTFVQADLNCADVMRTSVTL